jgi:hypothetical protein
MASTVSAPLSIAENIPNVTAVLIANGGNNSESSCSVSAAPSSPVAAGSLSGAASRRFQ